MKSFAIPDPLLGAAMALIKRLPAADDVVAVLNGLNSCVAQQMQNDEAAAKAAAAGNSKQQQQGGPKGGGQRPAGGGGPGEEK